VKCEWIFCIYRLEAESKILSSVSGNEFDICRLEAGGKVIIVLGGIIGHCEENVPMNIPVCLILNVCLD
jgi:hypothetical protein